MLMSRNCRKGGEVNSVQTFYVPQGTHQFDVDAAVQWTDCVHYLLYFLFSPPA
jgi:hypothetical protein